MDEAQPGEAQTKNRNNLENYAVKLITAHQYQPKKPKTKLSEDK